MQLAIFFQIVVAQVFAVRTICHSTLRTSWVPRRFWNGPHSRSIFSESANWTQGFLKLFLVLLIIAQRYFCQVSDEPATIYVSLYMESLSNFRATDMSFTVDMYVTEDWNDDRLKHEENRSFTVSDQSIIQKIWRPDIYFANAKTAQFHHVTKPNQFMSVYPNGHINYSFRVTGTFACQLSLHMYPMDEQDCSIRMLSYAYPVEQMVLRWRPHRPIGFNSDVTLPEMAITNLTPSGYNASYTHTADDINTVIETNFSCLKATIRVKRRIGYHLVQTYIPSSMVVAISWVSFWIDPYAVPARVTLSFTTLLTLTTQAAGVRMSLPPVSYAKAVDYWMGLCTMMVLAALVEYTFVNSYLQKAKRFKEKKELEQLEKVKSGKPSDALDSLIQSTDEGHTNAVVAQGYVRLALKIERYSRFVFPLTFLAICCVYCLIVWKA